VDNPATPNPPHGSLPGVATVALNAISCPSAISCVTVGRSDSRGTSRAVERPHVDHPAPARVAQVPGRGEALPGTAGVS
jgi:hypothetical protein